MTNHAYYGEADVGHDVFGERLSLLPEARPAKLEITRPAIPSLYQEWQAERRKIVNAEDDAFAKNTAPEYDLGKTLLFVQGSHLNSCALWIEQMPADQRQKYAPDLRAYADSLERSARRIRTLAGS